MTTSAAELQSGHSNIDSYYGPGHQLSTLLQAMLTYWSGQETVVIAVPSLGRPLPQLQSAVGYFINMLPVSGRLDPKTSAAELVRAVRDSMREAQANADVPFLEIMRAVRPARDASTTPVFQAMLMPDGTDASGKAPFGMSQQAFLSDMVSGCIR